MKKLFSFMLIIFLLSASVITVFATDNNEITYNIYLKNIKDNVLGIQFYVEFDDLKLKLDTVECPNLPTAIINPNGNNDGKILVNDSVLEGIDFTKNNLLLTAKFTSKVAKINTDNLNFKCEIECLYDIDFNDFTDYVLYDEVLLDNSGVLSEQENTLSTSVLAENTEECVTSFTTKSTQENTEMTDKTASGEVLLAKNSTEINAELSDSSSDEATLMTNIYKGYGIFIAAILVITAIICFVFITKYSLGRKV